MKHAKVKSLVAAGKRIAIEAKLGAEGFFEDKWGNRIFKTESPENQERLAKPVKKAAKKPVKKAVKKVTKKPAARKTTKK